MGVHVAASRPAGRLDRRHGQVGVRLAAWTRLVSWTTPTSDSDTRPARRPAAVRRGAAAVRRALLRNGGRAWLGSVVPRLDGEGKFREGGREPMLWVLLHAEFIVATSEVLDEGVSGADHPGRAQSF